MFFNKNRKRIRERLDAIKAEFSAAATPKLGIEAEATHEEPCFVCVNGPLAIEGWLDDPQSLDHVCEEHLELVRAMAKAAHGDIERVPDGLEVRFIKKDELS
jgi:hypothetical protein